MIDDYFKFTEESEQNAAKLVSRKKETKNYLDVFDTVIQMRYQRRLEFLM